MAAQKRTVAERLKDEADTAAKYEASRARSAAADDAPHVEKCRHGVRCDRDRIHVPLVDVGAHPKTGSPAARSGDDLVELVLCESHKAEWRAAKAGR